jgi:hypothetical protein
LRELRIDAAESDVRTDVANLALAAEPSVAAILTADGADATSTFVDNAAKKANGNIGYLDAVARAVDNAVTLNSAQPASGRAGQSGVVSQEGNLGPVVEVQLGEDPRDVLFHGGHAHEQFATDLRA